MLILRQFLARSFWKSSSIGSSLQRRFESAPRSASSDSGKTITKAFKRPKLDENQRPFVTPYIAGDRFGSLNVINHADFSNRTKAEPIELKRYKKQWDKRIESKSIRLVTDLKRGEDGGINDNILRADDYVLVKAGISLKKEAPVWEGEKPKFEFAKVFSLFERDGNEYAHVRWLAHGGETYMGCLADSRQLFLLTCCEDIPVKHILRKIQVDKVVGAGLVDTSSFEAKNHFYYRMHYDPDIHDQEDASLHKHIESDVHNKKCACCVRIEQIERFHRPEIIHTKGISSLRFKGTIYRENDIIYLPGKDENPDLHTIAQLEGFNEIPGVDDGTIEIKYRILERFDELREDLDSEKYNTQDERRLYYAAGSPVTSILSDTDLRGKCFVRHVDDISDLNAFKDQDNNHFYITDTPHIPSKMAPITVSAEAYKSHLAATEAELEDRTAAYQEDLRNPIKPLRGMSPYAGGGGMDWGFHQSRVANTEWAIDVDPAALASFSKNFPEAKTYNCRADLFLLSAINTEHLMTMSKPPQLGEVGILIAGPPCQGFTSSNSFKISTSVNNSQVLVFLSYIDYWQPPYFLMENVPGLLHFPLTNDDGIQVQSGTLRTIHRFAADHGYQVRSKILQCGDYGVPCRRARLVIWGAKIGYPLPEFPQASHVRARRSNGKKSRLTTRKIRTGAPHPFVTVGDTNGDLPLFEHELPPNFPLSERRRKEIDNRKEEVIQYPRPSVKPAWIGEKTQPYRSDPKSEFQRKSRAGASENVTNHIAHSRTADTIKKICSIHFEAGANLKSLQAESRPPSEDGKAGQEDNSYTRIDPKGQFRASMTTCEPASHRYGYVLPVNQNRQLSIRENCRIQSFPDTYDFDERCTVVDMQRIVGNAVPPRLAEALGKELYKVLSGKSTRMNTARSDGVDKEHLRSIKAVRQDLEMMMEEAEESLREMVLDIEKISLN